jgi:plasmid maintenance system antidote protein VapI
MATERAWPDLVIPPGEVLAEELIAGVTALQLAEVLGTSGDFWMRLEGDHELNKARLARLPGPSGR